MDWEKKARENLLPLSEQAELEVALAEWRYTGEARDYLRPKEICQIRSEIKAMQVESALRPLRTL